MSPVTPETVDHYVQMLADLHRVDPHIGDALFWMVVRGRGEPLTVADVARRLGADPGAAVPRTVPELEEGHAVLEQSDHGVIVLSRNASIVDPDVWARLSENAQVWCFWWLANSLNNLSYAADGRLVTELDVLHPEPSECRGRDPRALDSHLRALRDLAGWKRADDQVGVSPSAPYHRWETSLATMEAMTGVRLDVDRFTRRQRSVSADAFR
ncbi:DUF6461 domain-containing protein [Streptosporangium sp. DT93]|uniref:DUF6461 domain-containing protein n=1 Tax=Streptosporangium sp. DT93 TaxID=3393428 RepID=UPI003CEEF26D